MRIFLIRHGETEENAKNILQGHRYGTLSQRGRAQIGRLAERLGREPISTIYTSDLSRAHETALGINSRLQVPLIPEPLLRERCLGTFEGQPVEHYLAAIKEIGADPFTYQPPGGESILAVAERAVGIFSSIRDATRDDYKTILICAHGLFNRALLSRLQNLSSDHILTLEQENACVNIIDCNDGGTTVSLTNCTRHLASNELVARGRTSF